ncbi:MAG: PIN domain-containing protein [Acidimicrobiales bacterium]
MTLDAGALIALDRNDRGAWTALRTARADGVEPVVPAPVLVEVWRGAEQARLAQALRGCFIESLDEALARAAGVLCGRAGTHDTVDAAVIASASRRGGTVITGDPVDLRTLAAHANDASLRIVPLGARSPLPHRGSRRRPRPG